MRFEMNMKDDFGYTIEEEKQLEDLLYRDFISDSAIKRGMIQEKIATLKAILNGVRADLMLQKAVEELIDYDDVIKNRRLEYIKIMNKRI
jgi:hypothetical protein